MRSLRSKWLASIVLAAGVILFAWPVSGGLVNKPYPISVGGTGATTASAALTSLGASPIPTWSGAQVMSAYGEYTLTHPTLTLGQGTTHAVKTVDPLLVALLHFDGADAAATTTDSSGNAHTVTVAGNAQLEITDPKYGSAFLKLDGTGDYVTMPSAKFIPGAGNFTVEMWANPTNLTAQKVLFSVSKNGASSDEFILYITGTNGYLAAYSAGTGNYGNQASTTALTAGSWVHVAMVKNAGTTKLYVGGVEAKSFTDGYTYSGWSTAAMVGKDAGASGYDFLGGIDDFAFHNYAKYTAAFTPPTGALTVPTGDIYAPMRVVPFGTTSASDVVYVQSLTTETTLFRVPNAATYNFAVRP